MSRPEQPCRRRGLWRRTVLDVLGWTRLGPKKWERRAHCIEAGCVELENQLLASRRYPSQSDRERPKYKDHDVYRERLENTTAFGQWANQLSEERQRDAQHGLFGTSAALQVLSKSAWAHAARHHESRDGSATWAKEYVRTVNFIDMVVSSHAAGNGTPHGVAAELRVTLRACHVARALAAAAPVLRALDSHQDLNRYIDAAAKEDLREPLNDVAARNAQIIMNILGEVHVMSMAAPSPAYRPENASQMVPLYTFATVPGDNEERRDFPESADDWVFVYGSVLVALVRCWQAELIDHDQVAAEVCPLHGFKAFKDALRGAPSSLADLDDRLRLFGLWALSHLDGVTPGGPLDVAPHTTPILPPDLALHPTDDLSWFREQVEDVCRRLLRSDISLADSYSPYTFWIGPGDSDYKDDSLVAPVVPLLLSLGARYVPSMLARTKVLRLVEACVDTEARSRQSLSARPHQLSTQDGVVNLSYYQEACHSVVAAARTSMAPLRGRVRAHVSAFVRDWGKLALIGLFLLAAAVVYTIATVTDSTLAGFLYGVFASALAAVIFHGVVVWLWGDCD